MRELNLDKLLTKIDGITPALVSLFHEALLVALTKHQHKSGVELVIEGSFHEKIRLTWDKEISNEVILAWKNDPDVAHYAAVGLSILLFQLLTKFSSFEVAEYGTGIDYWISEKTGVTARLEISGIFQSTISNSLNMRISLKKKQVKKSDKSELPVWISVIAFNIPKSKIIKV